jgi:hypothetical protein
MPKFNVHAYVIVRVKVHNIEAKDDQDACIEASEILTEDMLQQMFPDKVGNEIPRLGKAVRSCGYAGNIDSYLVDEIIDEIIDPFTVDECRTFDSQCKPMD